MADPNREYFDFYLMGRDEADEDMDEGLDGERAVDFEALGKQVVAGEDIRELAAAAARKAGVTEKDMIQWRKSSRNLRKAIDAAGGDNARAYRSYCQGYLDGLAAGIELEIIEAICGEADDLEDDDEDSDEDVGPGSISGTA